MSNDLKIGMQYCIPKRLLTRIVGKLAAAKAGLLTTAVIRWFIRQYNVNISEAKNSNPASYSTFNDFFIRELRDGVRSLNIDPNVISHPADACISQAGTIEDGYLIQAKGHSFDACELLGGDAQLAKEFTNGEFATLYLSPGNYHRIHMPCDGTLRQMIYVPGTLFSVSPLTTKNVPNLFARNERVVCIFNTAFGSLAQILIGATIVGSIETTWAGTITTPTDQSIRRWDYPIEGAQAVSFKKGQEMGRFNLGSTVINLFPQGAIRFDDSIIPNAPAYMGEIYAYQTKESVSMQNKDSNGAQPA
ncbi:archaetidylserine decarboxylase [Candidatus Enterovibrio altilux]|uniref:Phosphatidylserine decarboxylase proenzyme n=1 Tax=Candidatus Enterovibrio altilux TaxID=1927128 RepID=A0A291B998_9GAMM|nr:archaetidylserine decarboxylase [Candidatus Enterovibrio luxaltus]ATF09580.1 Phosphatidylserine decarboxylase [Candidatus Enterovibrio luxaltus]